MIEAFFFDPRNMLTVKDNVKMEPESKWIRH